MDLALDAAFHLPRPDKFTSDEETDRFFQAHTIQSLGALEYESEIVPIAFLTGEAFLYLFPAIARMMRNGDKTGLLMMTEFRRHLFTPPQRTAIRDFLQSLDPAAEWMAAETIERLSNELGGAA